MRFRTLRVALALSLALLFPVGTFGDCADQLKELEGWTILSVTTVDGDFEGCDFGRRIHMTDGSVYTCAEYNYTYAYMPDAVVFAKKVAFEGKDLVMFKILVEDELMDMESKLAR